MTDSPAPTVSGTKSHNVIAGCPFAFSYSLRCADRLKLLVALSRSCGAASSNHLAISSILSSSASTRFRKSITTSIWVDTCPIRSRRPVRVLPRQTTANLLQLCGGPMTDSLVGGYLSPLGKQGCGSPEHTIEVVHCEPMADGGWDW